MNENEQPNVIHSKYPPSPPPIVIPHYGRTFRDIPITMKNCLYNYIYVWTINDGSFWMYPTSITPDNKLAGYQWDRNFWKYVELDISQIDSFF